MTKIVRFLCLLLVCALLLPCAGASAANGKEPYVFHFDADFSQESFGEVIERYLKKKRLLGNNISIGWYDLQSGEEYYRNPDLLLEGASTYKLPMAMVYADMIDAGEISLEDTIGPYVLRDALEGILVWSNNPKARVLQAHLSEDKGEFKRMLIPNSGLDESELPPQYFRSNNFSPRFLIGTLRTLYDNPEKYALLLDYLKQARPNDYISRYSGEIEVAHKYGSDAGFVCDTGIVYAERPFLLCVMCYGVGGAHLIISEIARIAMDYADYLAAQPAPTPAPTPVPMPEPAPEPTPAPTPEPTPAPEQPAAPEKHGSALLPIAVAASAALLILPFRLKKKKEEQP